MSYFDAAKQRRLRGLILRLIYNNHARQRTRLDDLTIHGGIQRMSFDVSRDEIKTVLQDLADRFYVRFAQEKDEETGRISLRLVQITAEGRDIVERTKKDPAVEIE